MNTKFGIFKDEKGEWSSKRFVGIIGAFVLYGTLAYNSTTHQDIAPSKELVQAVEWIVILTLGFTSIDKIGNKTKPTENTDNTNNTI